MSAPSPEQFRAAGFTAAAAAFPRPPEAIEALRRFNGVPADVPNPKAWEFFPNEHMRDNWQRYYGDKT